MSTCQDISVAGKGEGIDGARSGLWKEMHRVIDIVRPAWVIVENSPALRTRGADRVLGDLERSGYTCTPLVVGADDVGAPHRRKRVWIVGMADTDSWLCHGRERNSVGSAERRTPADGSGEARGGQLAHTALRGRGAGGRASGNARYADGGDEDVEHPLCAGREEPHAAAFADPTRPRGWPVAPGVAQHDWEAPRLIIKQVGSSVTRLPGRLARFANKHALHALGNSQVPQVVEVVARAIIAAQHERHHHV